MIIPTWAIILISAPLLIFIVLLVIIKMTIDRIASKTIGTAFDILKSYIRK